MLCMCFVKRSQEGQVEGDGRARERQLPIPSASLEEGLPTCNGRNVGNFPVSHVKLIRTQTKRQPASVSLVLRKAGVSSAS